jgi:hypothetical protein
MPAARGRTRGSHPDQSRRADGMLPGGTGVALHARADEDQAVHAPKDARHKAVADLMTWLKSAWGDGSPGTPLSYWG